MQPKEGGTQQSQPGQYMSGAAVARDRRNRGANRRSTDTAIGRHHSSNSIRVGTRPLNSMLHCYWDCDKLNMQAAADDDAGGAAVQAPTESLGVTGSAIQAAGCTSGAGDLQISFRGTPDSQLQSLLLVMSAPLTSNQSAPCVISQQLMSWYNVSCRGLLHVSANCSKP